MSIDETITHTIVPAQPGWCLCLCLYIRAYGKEEQPFLTADPIFFGSTTSSQCPEWPSSVRLQMHSRKDQ